MTDTTIDSEVDRLLATFIGDIVDLADDSKGALDTDTILLNCKDALTNLIAQEANKARLDELSNVRLDYGPYRAETFVDGKQTSLLDRIAQLGGNDATKS